MDLDDEDIPLSASERRSLLDALTAEVRAADASRSVAELERSLNRLVIGTQWSLPTIGAGARLFRVRKMARKPTTVAEVGAPPEGVASAGRVNEPSCSVLYLADTPATAISEVRSGEGTYCLTEWRVIGKGMMLANGGIVEGDLEAVFGHGDQARADVGGVVDDEVRQLFSSIFRLTPGDDPSLYRWSIAAARAVGFSHLCERTARSDEGGHTSLEGRHPFGGVAYVSVRSDRRRVNFAFNDVGQKHVELVNVQWVEHHGDGETSGIDFASSWGADGAIQWLGRPANLVIAPGGGAKLTKVDASVWKFETIDGEVPGFS